MNNKNEIIYVNMLGEFSITIGSQTIMDRNNESKKPWSLLEYLITFRDRNIPVEELIDLFWKDEASNNPAGALKTPDVPCQEAFRVIGSSASGLNYSEQEGLRLDQRTDYHHRHRPF